ncbi:PaaI family thioesterase [Thalassovita sp.]|uniref:PaaI family thioesterase n=1 Tax=Thalassovita sp. TaxID=1979401 RepID=UPI0029DE6B51|nr:PaaI family thioesterase [Thalassovita sp.]
MTIEPAQVADKMIRPEDLRKLSGLEAMRAMLEGDLPPPPIALLLNYRISEVEDGRVTFTGTPTHDMTNPMGTVHGGWYGTVLDSCMACAVMTKVPAGSSYTTLEYKINILRPIPLGTEVQAIGTAQHVGRSTGIANGEIRGTKDGKLYATGSTTCIVMKLG